MSAAKRGADSSAHTSSLPTTISDLLEQMIAKYETAKTIPTTENYLKTTQSQLLAAFEKHLPKKIDMLDTGELGGADGRTGFSAVAVSFKQGYNQAITDFTQLIKENKE